MLLSKSSVHGNIVSSLSHSTLYEEGCEGRPAYMTCALHARYIGQPGRFPALKQFVEYITKKEGGCCMAACVGCELIDFSVRCLGCNAGGDRQTLDLAASLQGIRDSKVYSASLECIFSGCSSDSLIS